MDCQQIGLEVWLPRLRTETEICASSCDSIPTLMTSQQLEVYIIQSNGLKREVCADQLEDLKNRWEPITFRLSRLRCDETHKWYII